MKPFNLEEAKAGKPVCTRDGRKVRILCFDLKDSMYPIIAAITELAEDYASEIEIINAYNTDGIAVNNISEDDLVMIPEKKTGWVNVYKSTIYNFKEVAKNCIADHDDYIDTVEVEYEE